MNERPDGHPHRPTIDRNPGGTIERYEVMGREIAALYQAKAKVAAVFNMAMDAQACAQSNIVPRIHSHEQTGKDHP